MSTEISNLRFYGDETTGITTAVGGSWVPGIYDSEATAALAIARFTDEQLAGLAPIYRVDGESRPVTMADLEGLT